LYNYDNTINNSNLISNREEKSGNRLTEKNNILELMNKKHIKNKMKLKLIEMKIFNSNNNNIIDFNNLKNHKNLDIDKIEAINCKLGTNLNKTIKSGDLEKQFKKTQNFTIYAEKEDLICANIIKNNEKVKKKIKVNLRDYMINYLFGRKRESLDLFVKFRDNLQKYLDVDYIIRKLNEIQKIKFFILDDRQIKEFDELKYLSDIEMSIENNLNSNSLLL